MAMGAAGYLGELLPLEGPNRLHYVAVVRGEDRRVLSDLGLDVLPAPDMHGEQLLGRVLLGDLSRDLLNLLVAWTGCRKDEGAP
jgi:hypothetical protein